MILAATELAYVRSLGFYVTEKCDNCKKLLNQTVRYTISNKPEVYCSAQCRDAVFFGDQKEAKKYSTPGKCAYCGGLLKGKKLGSLFCDDTCRKRASRKGYSKKSREHEKSRTPTQPNQELTDAKKGDTGNRIANAPTAPIVRAASITGSPRQDR